MNKLWKRFVTDGGYDDVATFGDTLVSVKARGKWGILDKTTGAVVVPLVYDEIRPIGDSSLTGVQVGGKWGAIDRNGTLVVPTVYDSSPIFIEGLASVQVGGKWGFVDAAGRLVVPAAYDQTSYFSEGLAAVSIGGNWGFIDSRGTIVVPVVYDEVRPFSEGLAPVRVGEKWGYADNRGLLAISAAYGEARSFNCGLAPVRIDGDQHFRARVNGKWIFKMVADEKWGFIDKKGTLALAAVYEDANGFEEEGWSAVQIGHKWGAIDTEGTFVVPPTYNERGHIFSLYYSWDPRLKRRVLDGMTQHDLLSLLEADPYNAITDERVTWQMLKLLRRLTDFSVDIDGYNVASTTTHKEDGSICIEMIHSTYHGRVVARFQAQPTFDIDRGVFSSWNTHLHWLEE